MNLKVAYRFYNIYIYHLNLKNEKNNYTTVYYQRINSLSK